MKLTINNFHGITEISVDVRQPVTIIRSHNAQGKSSVLKAVQKAFNHGKAHHQLGSTQPYQDFLPQMGTKVVLTTPHGILEWLDPDKYALDGTMPYASPVALENINFLDQMSNTILNRTWNEAIDPMPTMEEIQEACPVLPLSICKAVSEEGWDKVEKSLKNKKSRKKREWKQAVEECDGKSVNFNAKSSEEWKPEGWNEVKDKDPEQIKRDEQNAKSLKGIVANIQVVVDEESAVQKEISAALETLVEVLQAIMVVDHEPIEAVLDDRAEKSSLDVPVTWLRRARFSNDNMVVGRVKFMPSREGPTLQWMRFDNAYVTIYEETEELKKRKDAAKKRLAELKSDLAALVEKRKALQHEENMTVRSLGVHMSGTEPGGIVGKVDECNKQIDKTERKVTMSKSVEETSKIKEELDQLSEQIRILGHKGIRKTLRNEPLSSISDNIDYLNNVSGWGVVQVKTDTLEITFNNKPLSMCAESEKKRADIVLRLAIAMHDNSEIMLVDELDKLDSDNQDKALNLLAKGSLRRNRTLKVLCATNNTALVGNAHCGFVDIRHNNSSI